MAVHIGASSNPTALHAMSYVPDSPAPSPGPCWLYPLDSDEPSLRSPTAPKRLKTSASASAASPIRMSGQLPYDQSFATNDDIAMAPATTPATPVNPKKRRAPNHPVPPQASLTFPTSAPETAASAILPSAAPDTSPRKKGRTNTPWTPEEEQKLQLMRGESKGWSEIAKSFPSRTEGSVKKHWYKDMHYAEFNDDEASSLREAIREYDANKWKCIGQKVGKPAKACEHYAREHFRTS